MPHSSVEWMNNAVESVLKRVPLLVDSLLVVSLLSLVYWVGTQAEQLRILNIQMTEIQLQVHSVTIAADIATLKAKAEAQDRELLDMREYLGHRLDRIEQKLDAR
jgi:hypothetical protein